MQTIKTFLDRVKDNFTEIWLGTILFVGLPVVLALYLDWRAGVALSLVLQAIIFLLVIHRGNK